MTKIAFLGLGAMGAPMAMRLQGAGHELAVWNRSARLVNAAAAARHVDLQVARAAHAWLEAATQAQLGELDYSAVTAHIRHRPAR